MNKNGNASPYIRVVVLKNGPNADVKENGVQVVQTQAGKDQESNLVVLKQKTSTSRSMAVSKDNTSCNSVSSQTRGDINILKCIDLPEVGEAKFNQEMANGDTAENNPGNVALVSNKCETECTENKAVIDKTPQRIDSRYFRDDSFVCKKEASPLENCAVSAYICEANVRKEHYLNDDKTHIEKRVEIGQSLNEVPDIARLLQLTATSIAATKFTTGYSDDLKDETYYNQALLTKEENGNTKAGIRPYENGPKVFSCLGSRPVYPHKDMLEQMKKTISESFLRQVMQQKKDAEEQKMAQLLPGTDVEYRTPGANFRNKNGRVKRPMNAFMVWAREYRGRLAAAMPRATNSEISITLGRVWASMPPHEKQAYYDIAEKIKRKHRQDFPNWVYKPSFQRREEVPMPRPENPWARVIVDPSGSNKTITVTSQGAPATLETTTSVPNTFIPSDNTKQVLVGKSGPQIGSHQQGTLDTIAKPVAQVERIPVILQRVTLKTNAESSTSTSYVSSYTKGLLANKIAISNHSATQPSTVGITAHARVSAAISSRPEIAVVPQRQDVYLTPSLQKNLAMMSLMTSSIRTTHAQTLPAQIKLGDQQLHLLNKGSRGPFKCHLSYSMQQRVPTTILYTGIQKC
ncbi:hypothetical protein DPMN_167156 [Dreissena polymorpha]|uniref:Sex-determining region Y protein n=1 Tax=Dreissena polymorpha TaxID=45954 RepID=A0A9D4IW40_DREPO|nr:hypothetical protein DPMN_167156 [Dreissena polymorpha]